MGTINYIRYTNNTYILVSFFWLILLAIIFDILFPFTILNAFYSKRTHSIYSFIILIVIILLDSRWTPADLVERESELVSGNNIEFAGLAFTFHFLCESLLVLLAATICFFVRSIHFTITIISIITIKAFLLWRSITNVLIICIVFRNLLVITILSIDGIQCAY